MIDMMRDHYAVLSVASTASDDEIREAYRRQAKLRHPDLGGTHEAMLELLEAWEVLGDPVSRKHYDEALHSRTSVPPTSANTKANGVHPNHADWLIIPCRNCDTPLRFPKVANIRVTCPKCLHQCHYYARNFAAEQARKERPFWWKKSFPRNHRKTRSAWTWIFDQVY